MKHHNIKYLFIIICLINWSCGKKCSEDDCTFLNDFGVSAEPGDGIITLIFGQYSVIDGFGKTCLPDLLEFQLSEDNIDFRTIATVKPNSESYVIENLENNKDYFIKMVNLHCELDPLESSVISVKVGEIPLPEIQGMSGFFPQTGLEDIRLSPDKNQFIYRGSFDNWYLSSLNQLESGSSVAKNAFYAAWHPLKESEVAFVENISIDISQNLQMSVSKTLKTIDLESMTENILHVIPEPYDYWIHEFHYSLDGTTIFFISNKDNSSSTEQERNTFNNLWKIDVESGTMIALSDFLPISFQIHDFIEDPRQAGNFYIAGNYADESTDIHYYDVTSNSLSPVLTMDNSVAQLSVDPSGDNIFFATDRSGTTELWSYTFASNELNQITNSRGYRPSNRWQNLNWISDEEFMVPITQNNDLRLAIFKK